MRRSYALRPNVAAADKRGVSLGTLLTGEADLNFGQAVRYRSAKARHSRLTDTVVVVADSAEALIASTLGDMTATVTAIAIWCSSRGSSCGWSCSRSASTPGGCAPAG